MPSRKAEAEWKGNLIQGGGQLTVDSGAFRGPYTFKSRLDADGFAITRIDLETTADRHRRGDVPAVRDLAALDRMTEGGRSAYYGMTSGDHSLPGE
jgi:hypothetical protein